MRPLPYLLAPDLAAPLAAVRRETARAVGALWAGNRAGYRGGAARGAGESPNGGRRRRGPALLTLLAALALAPVLLAAPGLAQTIPTGLFAQADREARKLLEFLDDPGGALGEMLFAYNAGVLAIAALLLLWHTAAGLLDTAREGRPGLGLWETVRIAAAIALMAPLPGGMNAAQHLVLRLAWLGGDFAAAVWTPFAEDVLTRGEPIAPALAERSLRQALLRMLLVETCRHAADGDARRNGDGTAIVIRAVHASPGGGPDRLAALHYDGRGGGRPQALCGSVRYATPGGAEGLGGGAPAAAEAHRAAFEALRPRISALAAELAARHVQGTPAYGTALPDIARRLDDARLAEDYAGRLRPALQQARDREQQARLESARDTAPSWLQAATVFNSLAARTGHFRAAAAAIPAVSLPRANLAEWSAPADLAIKAIATQLQGGTRWSLPLATAALGHLGAGPAAGGTGTGDGDSLFSLLDLESITVADSGNPILDLAALGHTLINAALGGIATLGGVAAGSNLLQSVPFVGGGLDAFEAIWAVGDAFISLILAALLIGGAMLAYILPALPFLRFLMGILAWLLATTVAILAVTVFCAAHVRRGDGGGLATSASRAGWLFLPGLVLRPPLMLFGLILGYFAFLAILDLFNAAWLPQMRDAAGEHGIGPVGWLAMLYLYIAIAYALMNATFKLIDTIPEAALAWIGGERGGAGEADRLSGTLAGGLGRLAPLRVGRGARARPPGGAPP